MKGPVILLAALIFSAADCYAQVTPQDALRLMGRGINLGEHARAPAGMRVE